MKPAEFEFSRPIRVDRIPGDGCIERIAAEPAECEALARRFELPSIESLRAVLTLEPARGGGLRVHGQLIASVTQTCVVSLDEFASMVEAPVERFYLASAAARSAEVSVDELDADPIVNGEIDLGELVSESLGLSLDPYPHKPGATLAADYVDAGDGANHGNRAFAALERLRRQTSGE